MRIAVVGASGVIGRSFVPMAAAAGHTLVQRRVDIFDSDALTGLIGGCDAVVNLATSIPRAGGRGEWVVNDRIRREGTAKLLAACIAMGIKMMLQQSVAMLHCVADDRPQTEEDALEGYGVLASAMDMEGLVRAAPLDSRLVRGGLLYGPGTGRWETWLEEVRNPAFRIPGDGNAWLSLVHVQDYASALLQVLDHDRPDEAFIACDDKPLRLHELYAGVAARAGVSLPATGGVQRMRSFRVANTRLRALGWAPVYPIFPLDA